MATYDQIVDTSSATAVLRAKIAVGLAKYGATRAGALRNASTTPSLNVAQVAELAVCSMCLDGKAPAMWTEDVMILLATVTPTDAEIDTACQAAWPFFVNSRI